MHIRAVLIFISLLGLAVPAQADYEQDIQACVTRLDPELGHDTIIAACTRLIQSGRLSKTNLPTVLFNRGISYTWTNQNDMAIQDFNEVIRFKPRFADAFYNRGTVYFKTFQDKLALQDYKKAYNLGSRRPFLLEKLKEYGVLE